MYQKQFQPKIIIITAASLNNDQNGALTKAMIRETDLLEASCAIC